MNAARETADSICTEAVESIAPAAVEVVSAALVTLARTPNLALYEQRYRDDLLGTRRLAQPGGASVESMHSDFRHCPTSVP